MNKKIITLAVLSLCVTLIALPACNAVITPVEVERVKDIYFIRMRGDHNSESFLFHYVNLSPSTQYIKLYYAVKPPGGLLVIPSLYKSFSVAPGESIDDARVAGVGYTLDFIVKQEV